jgi:hypothetical protein
MTTKPKDEKVERRPAYDGADLLKMEKEVNALKADRRGGKLCGRLDLYLEAKGIIRFDEYGQMICRDASAYTTAQEMWSIIERKNAPAKHAEHEKLRQLSQSPEAQHLSRSRTCVICTKTLAGHAQWYCSGVCVAEAKQRGVYGREEQQLSGAVSTTK